MAVDWEARGIGSTARIVAVCDVCHVQIETDIAASTERVLKAKFKHCGKMDSPPQIIQESFQYLRKEPAIKERGAVRWI